MSKRDQVPGVVRIRAGLIDGTLGVKPGAHFYVDSRADWWEINDDLPKSRAADAAPVQDAPKKAT